MIVEYVKGNAISLFLSRKYGAFGHGCNIYCRMGSGIAKEVRERLSELWELDQKTEEGDRKKLGTADSVIFPFGIAFNMYTQATFWNPADMLDYHAVRKAFRAVNDAIVWAGVPRTMCIPKIGAGLAQGDWDQIAKIIDQETPDIEITVVEFDGSR